MSPAVYAEQVAVEAEAVALRKEVAARERLRVTERAAAEQLETACREQLGRLGAEADRPGRVSAWKAVGILAAGALLGLIPGFILGGGLGVR